MNDEHDSHTKLMERSSTERAMAWYGWGSPVGAGLFLISVAATVAILRYAIWPIS